MSHATIFPGISLINSRLYAAGSYYAGDTSFVSPDDAPIWKRFLYYMPLEWTEGSPHEGAIIDCSIFADSLKTLSENKQVIWQWFERPWRSYGGVVAWWRHQMETYSALLALCAGLSPVTSEFPTQRPVTRSFDVFFDLRLNKRLGKQSWGGWFETISRSLWRHCNGSVTISQK